MDDAPRRARAPTRGGLVLPPARQARLEAVGGAEHRQCLLCGPANPLGLQLRFEVEDDGSVAALLPCRAALQGYPQTLHGGVISAVLDAAMTNALFSKGVAAVTAELTVRFLAPARLDAAAVVRARVERATSRLFVVSAALEQGGRAVARASAKFLARRPARGAAAGPRRRGSRDPLPHSVSRPSA